MSRAKVTFYKCIQDSKDLGSNEGYMVSRVCFTLEIDNKKHENLYVDIIQTIDDNFALGAIKVGNQQGYLGPFNYPAFSDAAEEYYTKLMDSHSPFVRNERGVKVRTWNNVINRVMIVEFEASYDSFR